MEIDTVLKMAKEKLSESGSLMPILMVKSGKDFNHQGETISSEGGMIIFDLGDVFDNADNKEKAREAMRPFILSMNPEYYYFITEAWLAMQRDDMPSHNIIPIRQRLDRQECIIISKFSRDMKNDGRIQRFTRKDEEIIYEKLEDKGAMSNIDSTWNFFVEKEGMFEKFDNLEREHQDKFIQDMAKRFSKKTKERFLKGEISKHEFAKEFMEFVESEKTRIDQNTLEDTEKENEISKDPLDT